MVMKHFLLYQSQKNKDALLDGFRVLLETDAVNRAVGAVGETDDDIGAGDIGAGGLRGLDMYRAVPEAYEKGETLFFACIGNLISRCAEHGYRGNLWQVYLSDLLVNDENAYSLSCEIGGAAGKSLMRLARRDFQIFYELFHADLLSLGAAYDYEMTDILHYESDRQSSVYNHRIRDMILALAEKLNNAPDVAAFAAAVTEFYRNYGVGRFGLHKAFRLDNDGNIVPITRIFHVSLDDLIGYEVQKKKLIDNTEAFVSGRPANNCLLFGDAGTGKSTSMKAIVNRYYDRGLRMIEVYKHEFRHLNRIISEVKNRNYKFIIYMDDLSFDDFETEYKYLKAVIEGGLERKPDNVLIYATSNRRHLIRESMQDNRDIYDLHQNDSKQEKLSLSARFGVTIYYGAPDKKEFDAIVLGLKEKFHIEMDDDELLLRANQWEMHHSGRSGRTAQQFIDTLRKK